MLKELSVALAQIVEPGFTCGGVDNSVLWALAVAGKQPLAFAALPWQGVVLGVAKCLLLWAVHHLGER